MLYFVEVLLEALFFTVDPYMRYYFPPENSYVVHWTLLWRGQSFKISSWFKTLWLPPVSPSRMSVMGFTDAHLFQAKVWAEQWGITLAPLLYSHPLSSCAQFSSHCSPEFLPKNVKEERSQARISPFHYWQIIWVEKDAKTKIRFSCLSFTYILLI